MVEALACAVAPTVLFPFESCVTAAVRPFLLLVALAEVCPAVALAPLIAAVFCFAFVGV